MAKKQGKRTGTKRPKRGASVKDLLLRSRRGDAASAVKGGKARRPSCIPM